MALKFKEKDKVLGLDGGKQQNSQVISSLPKAEAAGSDAVRGGWCQSWGPSSALLSRFFGGGFAY